ncbi:MAG: sigma-E factor negative regulatory protein [Pseudomonadota bacterium]
MAEKQSLEQLSCFIDSELQDAESRFLCRRLSHDTELRSEWHRYHLIGAALRREAGTERCIGLADRISAALEDEAVPSAATAPPGNGPRWLRPVAGIAVAASVALGVYALLDTAPPPGLETAPAPTVAATADNPNFDAVQGLPARISTASAPAARAATTVDAPIANTPITDPRMQAYLLRHNEAAVGQSQGLVPYIYMVAAPEDVEVANARQAPPSE